MIGASLDGVARLAGDSLLGLLPEGMLVPGQNCLGWLPPMPVVFAFQHKGSCRALELMETR